MSDTIIQDLGISALLPAFGLFKTATKPKEEEFGASTTDGLVRNIMSVICIAVAIYLAIKCKSTTGQIDPLQVVVAIFCAPCYIIYRIMRPCGMKF